EKKKKKLKRSKKKLSLQDKKKEQQLDCLGKHLAAQCCGRELSEGVSRGADDCRFDDTLKVKDIGGVAGAQGDGDSADECRTMSVVTAGTADPSAPASIPMILEADAERLEKLVQLLT
ncbi:unnamed protein product, partial [Prorocentrum cordatum]